MINLETNPRPFGYKKLKGREAYRIRVGITELFFMMPQRFLKPLRYQQFY